MELTPDRSLPGGPRAAALLVTLSGLGLVSTLALATACGGASADGAATPAASNASTTTAAATAAPAPSAPTGSPDDDPLTTYRFDMLVRDDFFAGLLQQDQAALARAMKLCEETLARKPDHAEALVWHGGGLILHAGQAFRAGDKKRGAELWTRGLAEMDRAVELEPDEVGTRIPRGATLMAIAQFVPEPERSRLLATGVDDYERALALQKDHLDHLSTHGRSALLFGLADGWHRRGDKSKAKAYYVQLEKVAGASPYGKRARAYLAGDTATRPIACGGCHAE